MKALVLDTNIVLDLFVFDDPATRSLKQALLIGNAKWLATLPMRDELMRVLGYPKILNQLIRNHLGADHVMAQFDRIAHIQPVPVAATVICSDPDDQKFIDLALAQQAELISKDEAVLRLEKRLAGLGVQVSSVWVN